MFFVISKVLGFFALPSNLLISLGVLGVLLMRTRFVRVGRGLASTSIIWLVAAGLSPLGNALIYPLEERFPPWDVSRGAPDGIVVLGGAIGAEVSSIRGTADLNESAERLTATAELARRFPAARIIYSGASNRLVLGGAIEVDAAASLLEGLGVPRGRIITEGKARNTVENAVFSKVLANPKPGERWLLVTSGYHMPRAVGVFRKIGFTIEPYPVDWRTRGAIDLVIPFDALSSGLRRTDTAMREWIGLFVYWISDRSSALFPGP